MDKIECSCLVDPSKEYPLSRASWSPPPVGAVKLNVDDAWLEKNNRGRVRWIVRDTMRYLVCAGWR